VNGSAGTGRSGAAAVGSKRQKVRVLSLTSAQAAAPLIRRPYDLRHSGVTWRLNSGTPATEVAAGQDTASKC
jgi:hypothetical protein